MAGVTLLEDFEWYPDACYGSSSSGGWVLRLRLAPEVDPTGSILEETDWCVWIEPSYPYGAIRFLPAKEGGITQTYHHQQYNYSGNDKYPWRTGWLCLDESVAVLRRNAYQTESFSRHDRLRWHCERALSWLKAASKGELASPGDPFELPQVLYLSDNELTIAYCEGPENLAEWEESSQSVGLLHLKPLYDGSVLLVDHFLTETGDRLRAIRWGKAVERGDDYRVNNLLRAAWIRLPSVPVLEPWQAPLTWGEFRRACCSQGADLDKLMSQVVPRLRDGNPHFMFVGFPIPERVNESYARMHWLALHLPVLTRHGSGSGRKGRRLATKRKKQLGRQDRETVLRNDAIIRWQPTENWRRELPTECGPGRAGIRQRRRWFR
jgi:hypothetical protein